MKLIQKYLKQPTTVAVMGAITVTLIAGTLAGEYVFSRPVNSYIQGATLLAFLAIAGTTAQMLIKYFTNQVTIHQPNSKTNQQ